MLNFIFKKNLFDIKAIRIKITILKVFYFHKYNILYLLNENFILEIN